MSCVLKTVQDITGISIILWSAQAFKVDTCLHLFSKNGQNFPKKLSVNFGGVGGLPEENYEGYFCSLH